MARQWERFKIGLCHNAYVDWALDPGNNFPPRYELRPNLGSNSRFDILLTLNDKVSFENFMAVISRRTTSEVPGDGKPPEKPYFKLSPFYDVKRELVKDLRQFPAAVDLAFLTLIEEDRQLFYYIRDVVLAQKLPEDAVCGNGKPGHIQEPGPEVPEGICVVGIIDEGIAFANERFRSGTHETRVEHLWIQDARCDDPKQAAFGGYGRELEKTEIDELLRTSSSAGLVDEDEVYRRAGLADFSRPGHKAAAWRASHGAHVMDLACGYPMGEPPRIAREVLREEELDEDYELAPDSRPIICVQLPSVMIADTSGLGLEKYLLDAMAFIYAKANTIAHERNLKSLPLVINFSSGVRAGPHDGTHPVETAIDDLVKERIGHKDWGAPTAVVLPSGNGHLARIHARVSLKPKYDKRGAKTQLTWRIQPDDRTFSFLEIWLPHELPAKRRAQVKIKVTPPESKASRWLSNAVDRKGYAWKRNGSDTLCKISYESCSKTTQRGRFLIAVLPTALPDAPTELAPSGDWTITIKNLSDKDIENIESWIHWDDSPLGYRRNGRQSYFIDECYERFDPITGREIELDNESGPNSPIKREGNISGIATGEKTIVIGGYMGKELKAASYSAGGPIIKKRQDKTPHRTGPDAMAVCEKSEALWGVLATGTRSGSAVALNGTSVAAPQVTRMVADALALGKTDARAYIKEKAAKDESEVQAPEPAQHSRSDSPNDHRKAPSEDRKGFGRLSFQETRLSHGYRKPA